MRTQFYLGMGILLSLAACQSEEVPVEVDNRTPVVMETPPPAITGGTMLVLSDGRVLVADADRDRVHIVSLSPPSYDADLLFEQGVEPGRSIEGSEGLVHVVLRGAGDVATIDGNTGELLGRRHLCVDPRGIAYAPNAERLFVTCSDGTLVDMAESPGSGDIERHFIEPDLRDIVVDGDTLLISRLRSAEVLEVPLSGSVVLERRKPGNQFNAVPTVAWRMIETRPGQVAMLHQFSSTDEVRVTPPDNGSGDGGGHDSGDGGGDGGAPYGGGGFCEPAIVSPGISTWTDSGPATTMQMPGPTPAVDLAMGLDGQFAIAVAGAPEGTGNVHFSNGDDFCFEGFNALVTPGQPVSVAYLPDGRLLVQSREPSALYVYQGRQHELTIELSNKSVFDTGHDLYHRATGAAISCASCHPEATDDGHTWLFEDFGERRTQSPEVGLEGSAPFHWAGDMDTFHTLANEVYTDRMGGPMQSDARAAAFERWLFSTERAPAGAPVEESLRAEGEALFASYGCTSCHAGPRLSTNQTVAFRGEALQVPSLRRVSLRPPFMHDGRSATLRDAVLDMLSATQPDADFSGHEVDAMTAYLRTL